MSPALVALGLITMLVLPHRLHLERSAPATGIAVWSLVLALRALMGVFLAVYVILYLPATALVEAISRWCLHTVLPLLATHLGFSGHSLIDAATFAPAAVLATSLLWAGLGVARGAARVRRALDREALGPGPEDSVIVGGADIFVAAAGFRHPRVVVSAGALTVLDDAELEASLAHERGHIARRHRWVLLFAQSASALARFIPGTRRAARELGFHIERDADQWAVRRSGDPLALASAICKAASTAFSKPALTTLGAGSATRRVAALIDPPARGCARGAAGVLAAVLGVWVVALAIALPAAASAGMRQATHQPAHACTH